MQIEKISNKKCELEKLTVLPDHRHLGLSKKLLDFAKEKAT